LDGFVAAALLGMAIVLKKQLLRSSNQNSYSLSFQGGFLIMITMRIVFALEL
jgi:hypothetical protein